ncbi:MAG: hypothetical protein GC138_04815 [Gammaproteobacteria bacterium]|nr:hypothetical protein [Gammaproteobacteria bacterium]
MSEEEHLGRISFKSRPEELCGVRRQLKNLLSTKDCQCETLECIIIAINEACMNVIEHAYHGRCDGDIVLDVFYGDRKLVFRLTDYADHVDPVVLRPKELNHLEPGGLGVYLLDEIMDEMRFMPCLHGEGNILEMKKCLDDNGSPMHRGCDQGQE